MTEVKAKGPSKAAAGVAATLPPLFALTGCCVLPVAMAGDYDRVEQMVAETGIWFYVIVGAGALSALVCAVLLLLAGRGARVPAAVTVLMATLPWLCGLAGTSAGMAMVSEAVAVVDPSDRAMLMAVGVAEASNAAIAGAWVAASLLSAVAIGLALGSVGQRAPERRVIGAPLGIAAVLPMLGLAAWVGLTSSWMQGGMLFLPSLGALLACAVAAAGVGHDEPHRRSVALAAAAPVAAGLAFVATAHAAYAGATTQVVAAFATVGSGSFDEILVAASQEMVPLRLAATWGGIAALLPVLGVGAWAALRGGVSGGRIAGAIALLLVAALCPASDTAVRAYTRDALAGVGAQPWDGVAGFEPSNVARGDGCGTVRVLATMDGLASAPAGGDAVVAWSDGAGLEERIRAAMEPVRPYGIPAPGEERSSDVAVALDRRLPAEPLRALVRHAAVAGVTSMCFVGPRGVGLSTEQRAVIERTLPVLAAFGDRASGARVRLGPGPEGDGRAAAYVVIADDATGQAIVTGAADAAERGIDALLVPSALPPETAPAGALLDTGDLGMIGIADLGPIGQGMAGSEPARGGAGHVDPGTPQARGSLPREVIQRVVRRHMNEIRYCYERELVRDPTLRGTVRLSFVIGPDGRVVSATAERGDLPEGVTSCVVAAVRRWTFPAFDGGGVVVVTYPFVFTPGA